MRYAKILPHLCVVVLLAGVFAQPANAASVSPVSGENPELTIARSRTASPWPEPDPEAVRALQAQMREKLPQFYQTRIGPWVIATDLDAESAQRFAAHTIARTAADIQRQLFTVGARGKPVQVLLFKDKQSYEFWTVKLYGRKPGTPFGYYSREQNALVMNIGTGGGTLIHEMVHAMAECDYPKIPAWLNEGIGSLFEACGRSRAGRVIGITNWRLSGLQQRIAKGTAPKFETLLAMDDDAFYGEDSGANYAAARYLMQFLQERGLFENFYWRMRDKKDDDALATLRFLFDYKFTVEQIEQQCYAWVRTLAE